MNRRRVVEVQSFAATHRPVVDARVARVIKTAAPPPFIPPATMDGAKQRRGDLVQRIAAAQLWLGSHGKFHPERDARVAACEALAAELRDLKRWMQDQHDATMEADVAEHIDRGTVGLIRGLSDLVNRFVDDGARLTDAEQRALDKAARWLAACETDDEATP